jgi:spore coat protein CotF
MDYKADITLNEKDSIQDLLNTEKQMVKLYATAITEGCSKGFREVVNANLNKSVNDQMSVFCMMTDCGYYRVQSAPEQTLKEQKQKFNAVKKQLC